MVDGVALWRRLIDEEEPREVKGRVLEDDAPLRLADGEVEVALRRGAAGNGRKSVEARLKDRELGQRRSQVRGLRIPAEARRERSRPADILEGSPPEGLTLGLESQSRSSASLASAPVSVRVSGSTGSAITSRQMSGGAWALFRSLAILSSISGDGPVKGFQRSKELRRPPEATGRSSTCPTSPWRAARGPP